MKLQPTIKLYDTIIETDKRYSEGGAVNISLVDILIWFIVDFNWLFRMASEPNSTKLIDVIVTSFNRREPEERNLHVTYNTVLIMWQTINRRESHFISVERKKNVVKTFIKTARSEDVERKITIITAPPFNSGQRNSKKNNKYVPNIAIQEDRDNPSVPYVLRWASMYR